MNRNDDYVEIDLLQLGRALWHRAWAIILAAVIFGGAAFSVAAFALTPLYEAEAYLYVNNSTLSVGSTSVSLSDLSAAQSLVDTYIVILERRETLEEVIEQTGVDYTYEELLEMIEADAVNSTEVFSITVTSADPDEAKLIANTIAEILPERISEIVEGTSVKIVDHAVTPAEKAWPNVTKVTAIGLVLGAMLACAVIIVRELNDTVIHNEEYLIDTYHLPILAAVPNLAAKHSGSHYYSGYETKKSEQKGNRKGGDAA